MDERLKQRLVGATVLVSLGVIFAPMILDRPSEPPGAIHASNIPSRPDKVFREHIEPVSRAEILEGTTEPEAEARSEKARGKADRRGPVAQGATPGGDVSRANEPQQATAKQRLSAWAVQLGSFAKAANAYGLRDQLRTKGYPAFVESVRVDNLEIKRVYVGPELLRATATASQKKLEKEVGLRGLVVRYPTGRGRS